MLVLLVILINLIPTIVLIITTKEDTIEMTTEPHIDIGKTRFETPVKCIFDSQGASDFQQSVAIGRLKFYLEKYTRMVNHQQIVHKASKVAIVNRVVSLLSSLSQLVDETPPFSGPRRYGNLACRDWHTKLEANIVGLLQQVLPEEYHNCIPELSYYLGNSFGSSTRLDYGTGHELSFLAVLGALDMLGLWTDEFSGEDVTLMFDNYYKLVRKLILTYTLEPAGSHGVWGLDDHFHIIYILGSSQWSNDPRAPLAPRDVKNRTLVQDYADTNFYCQAIDFIFHVKSGPFSEHSSMLYDVASTVQTWSKVQSGLLKMYYVEVLKKFPVVQHFWFGTGFYPWISGRTGQKLPIYENVECEKKSTFPTMTTMAPSNITMCHIPTQSVPHGKLSQTGKVYPTRGTMHPPTALPRAFHRTLPTDKNLRKE